jgi:pre-mRNA-processing factor 39
LLLEIDQPTSSETEQNHYEEIKRVVDEILTKSRLPEATLQELVSMYMRYLLERGTKEATKEYMSLDREINGPASVQKSLKANLDVGKVPESINGQVCYKLG